MFPVLGGSGRQGLRIGDGHYYFAAGCAAFQDELEQIRRQLDVGGRRGRAGCGHEPGVGEAAARAAARNHGLRRLARLAGQGQRGRGGGACGLESLRGRAAAHQAQGLRGGFGGGVRGAACEVHRPRLSGRGVVAGG
ncbi:hypothetical protein SDC9_187024 [bioreactor metagenome]|uniref:Uncharacterized protein n=1 Tax=bioreactor metagenome TaxID=1076179 RepID=A0A645HLT7_9ZZZZ